MVYDTIPSLLAGRRVLSTVRILDFVDPRPCDDEFCEVVGHPHHPAAHPLYVPFTDYRQLLAWTGGDVLMDEVVGVASSRESGSMPVQVANYLCQLRRRDVLLRWTAPNWARADKIIREVSQAVTDCRGYAPKTRRDGGERLWRDRRLFVWRTYDAFAFDEFSSHKKETIRPRQWQVFRRPGSLAERAYDTLDQVAALGAANDAGLCIVCGGRRRAPTCSCTREPETFTVRRPRRVLAVDDA